MTTKPSAAKSANFVRIVRSLPIAFPRRDVAETPKGASQATNGAVSSAEIAAAIEGSFSNGAATKSRILDSAEKALAGTAVMRLLHQLPNIRYSSAQDVWKQLPSSGSHPDQ